ncbi:MAG TPA: TonB-dependent receptor [Candidatus Eisenbacteria bacterium]|nr:TonB-dependent receptor [Candidatus Eisenbacteria bacterium]
MDLLLALAFLAAAPSGSAGIAGTVRDAETAQPLAGAAVLLPELERGTLTDSAGRYVLSPVPPGPHHLEVRLLGYSPRVLHALVPSAGALSIDVALRAQPVSTHSVEVRAPITIRGVEPGTTVFPDREASSTAIANHPLLAEPEGFHALEGGEASLRPETAGGVYLRGGAADQTAFLIDGVPVLSPYHAGGISSAWNTDALSRVYLRASDPWSSAPGALSGTIEGVTREPGPVARSQGSISTTQARITFDGPLAGGGYVLSARGGVHDLVAPSGERSYLSGGVGDALAKLETPAFGGRARALYYGNTNQIGTAAAAEETPPAAPRNDFDWDGRSFGLDWRRDHIRVLGWSASGDATADWDMPVGRLSMEGERQDAGVRLALHSEGALASSALELDWRTSRTRYRTVPDSAGVPFALDSDFPIATLAVRQTLHVGAGMELDSYIPAEFAEGLTRAAPQVRLRWNKSPSLTFLLAYLRTHQYAQSLRNPESVVDHVFPADVTIGSAAAGIPVAESDQRLIAADWRWRAGIRLGLEAYDRDSRNLLLVAPRDGEPFSTGGFVIGSSRSQGIALDLAAGSARWAVVASYGWQDVRLFYGDSSYVPEHGAKHRFEGGVIVHPSATSSVRLGAWVETGRRTTSIPTAFEWESCNLLDEGCEFGGSPHYGNEPLGGTPLPAYARVDLGVRKHWHARVAGRDGSIALFGTYSNLFSRENLLTYAYDPSTGEQVGVELRPAALLVIGIDWRW